MSQQREVIAILTKALDAHEIFGDKGRIYEEAKDKIRDIDINPYVYQVVIATLAWMIEY